MDSTFFKANKEYIMKTIKNNGQIMCYNNCCFFISISQYLSIINDKSVENEFVDILQTLSCEINNKYIINFLHHENEFYIDASYTLNHLSEFELSKMKITKEYMISMILKTSKYDKNKIMSLRFKDILSLFNNFIIMPLLSILKNYPKEFLNASIKRFEYTVTDSNNDAYLCYLDDFIFKNNIIFNIKFLRQLAYIQIFCNNYNKSIYIFNINENYEQYNSFSFYPNNIENKNYKNFIHLYHQIDFHFELIISHHYNIEYEDNDILSKSIDISIDNDYFDVNDYIYIIRPINDVYIFGKKEKKEKSSSFWSFISCFVKKNYNKL